MKDAKALYKHSKTIVWSLMGLFLACEALSVYRQIDEEFSKENPVIRAYNLMKESQFLQPWYISKAEAFFRDLGKRHYDTGIAFYNQEKWSDALREFQLAREFDPRYKEDFDLWIRVGYSALKIPEKEEEASDAYNTAVRLNPRDKVSWHNRGVALWRLGNLKEALSCYDRALQIDPTYRPAQNNRATLLAKMAGIRSDRWIELRTQKDRSKAQSSRRDSALLQLIRGGY